MDRVWYQRALLISAAAIAVIMIIAGCQPQDPVWKQYTGSAEVRSITPTLTGKEERCLTCHYGIEEISESHPVEEFGCVRCHGGDGLALDADHAHDGMVAGRNPAAMDAIVLGCGGADCHGGTEADQRDHIQRVQRSVQATYAGAINILLHDFNITDASDPYYGIIAAGDSDVVHSEAVSNLLPFDAASFEHALITQFGQNCQTCHLSAEPIQEAYYYRGTGCTSCHVIYAAGGLYRGGDPTLPRDVAGYPNQHRLTVEIPYTTCNSCHNRGNYSLARMEFIPRDDMADAHLITDPTDYRVATYYQPIGQYTKCEWELDCIDCHTSREAMGDGDIYISQQDARTVQCKTCHGTLTEEPTIATVTHPDDPAIRVGNLNPHFDVSVGDQVVQAPDGSLMGWVWLENGQLMMVGKVTGTHYEVPLVAGTTCEQQPDQQESRYCHECHAYQKP